FYGAAESVDGKADRNGPGQLRGTFHQLQELKRRYPRLKVIISFGGWDQSGGFSSAAQPEHVRDFVRSCVDTFIQGRFAPGLEVPGIFDGIDIDWEYPAVGGGGPGRVDDVKNFTAMLAEFRRQLDAIHPGLLLTAALPAEAELYEQLELKNISGYLDVLSIMAYDEHWSSEPLSNLQSALFHDPADPSQPPLDKRYGDYAVRGFLAAGAPKEKIVLGVPFYGKGWAVLKDENHGLYQPASGPADAISYRKLKALRNADRHYDENVATCTLWSQGKFWSYDCPEAMRAKMDYIRRLQLGGVMFWELSHDTEDGELLRILASAESQTVGSFDSITQLCLSQLEGLMKYKFGLFILLLLCLSACSHSNGGPSKVSGSGTTSASGLQYWDIVTGNGATAAAGNHVTVQYTGWLTDGTKFDSSVDRGQPLEFILGAHDVIRGWDEGVAGMKVGGKRQLRVPPNLGYGSQPAASIPPDSTLIFDIELQGVK
ncbi:MAG TPA: glycosyl hydrolase family 18 protein, partial [Candidatus Angelobacter sp.]